jgi:hypothetical protein
MLPAGRRRQRRGAALGARSSASGDIEQPGGGGLDAERRYGYGGEPATYQGDPSAGSAELGHAIRETMAQGCLEYVEKVTSGEMSSDDVRSIASEPAIIQPGFWQRLGLISAVAAGAAGFAWALRRRQTLPQSARRQARLQLRHHRSRQRRAAARHQPLQQRPPWPDVLEPARQPPHLAGHVHCLQPSSSISPISRPFVAENISPVAYSRTTSGSSRREVATASTNHS